MQAGGPRLWNVKGLHHYSRQLLICSPAAQSPEIIGTLFHTIISVSGTQGADRGHGNEGLRESTTAEKAVNEHENEALVGLPELSWCVQS